MNEEGAGAPTVQATGGQINKRLWETLSAAAACLPTGRDIKHTCTRINSFKYSASGFQRVLQLITHRQREEETKKLGSVNIVPGVKSSDI